VWLPTDAPLHWLLGELANAEGDVTGAFKAMDAAVYDFHLSTPELKEHRVALQEEVNRRNKGAADALPPILPVDASTAATGSAPSEMDWKGWLVVGAGIAVVLLFLGPKVLAMVRRR
jgi:hypothetical protein